MDEKALAAFQEPLSQAAEEPKEQNRNTRAVFPNRQTAVLI